jgi:hypothetical protein
VVAGTGRVRNVCYQMLQIALRSCYVAAAVAVCSGQFRASPIAPITKHALLLASLLWRRIIALDCFAARLTVLLREEIISTREQNGKTRRNRRDSRGFRHQKKHLICVISHQRAARRLLRHASVLQVAVALRGIECYNKLAFLDAS